MHDLSGISRSVGFSLQACLSYDSEISIAELSSTKRESSTLMIAFDTLDTRDVLESFYRFMDDQIAKSQHAEVVVREVDSTISASSSRQIETCLAMFRGRSLPMITMRDYIKRLHLHCPFTPPKVLAIVHYLCSLQRAYPHLPQVLSSETSHRLLLAAVVIASKMLDDRLMPQVRYAVVGGITSKQLLGLELAFIFLIDGNCWLDHRHLQRAAETLDAVASYA